MGHDARSLANEIIRRAQSNGQQVTPLQVIKLVYYCHAWMLGLYGTPLSNQSVEAWQYGPVIPDVYSSLKQYGANPITHFIGIPLETYDARETNLVDQVWAIYGQFSGLQLSAMTHAVGTPWHQIWNQLGKNAIIPNALMQQYYSDQLKGNDE